MTTTIPLQILPIEKDGFHLMIVVEINRKKANLIIDTGASRTVFDEELIKKFLPDNYNDFEINEELSTGLGTNSIKSQAFELKSLKLGDLKIKNYMAVILDLANINQSYSMLNLPEIHGVIGGDLLKKHKAVIQYKNKILKLYYQ
ncbi:MAG: clan AA aspartic protease [Bacteroidetes bacterium]|nr:clan AA aspartic protease [Bacteroidota bacterium]